MTMNSNRLTQLGLSVALLVGFGFSGNAQAVPIPACVANDVIAGDPSCPASGLCTITQVFTIADGCVLDFGTRDVTMAASGELRLDTASATLKARDFTVGPGGLVDGETNTVGGSFTVEATGDIAVQKGSATGKIRMSGKTQGGSLRLEAGGDITIDGQLHAHNRTMGEAAGGDITLRAGGNVVLSSGSDVDPHGGDFSFGGFFDVVAGGLIDIGSPIDVTGGDGGSMAFLAGGNIVIREDLNVTGQGDAGSGGDVDIFAGTNVEINAKIQSRGTGSAVGSGGGDGGFVFISAGFGNIIVRDEINVQSGTPDGGGGDLELFAHGSIDVQPAASLIGSGNGFESDGGEVLLDAGVDITVNGLVEAEGGDSGGEVGIEAGRNVTINALVRARSTNSGSFGGSVTLQAGLLVSGNLVLNNTVDASGPGCDAYGFCSLGGDIDGEACDLTVGSLGVMDVSAPGLEGNGGAIFLTARDQMTIQGSLDATGAGGILHGSNTFVYPSGVLPIVTGTVFPAPINAPRAMCTGNPGDPSFCLTPCPACGDGVTEFPETCDDTTGTPVSCDGCSVFCQLEDCDDQSVCTIDSCDPLLGCRHDLVAAGTLCRAATGPCDLPETCTGVSSACPADAFRPNTTVCRGSTDLCDAAETCTGTSAACPADELEQAGNLCRASAGGCDPEETCTGSSAVCPDDELDPAGTVCRSAAGVCDLEELCNGISVACPADFKSTAECRASAGVCDVAESCNGVSNYCPANGFAPASQECRASAGVCDVAENCTGTGSACPSDAKSTGVCRAPAGLCDLAESCDGVSNYCPADTFAVSGAVCRASAGVCDLQEQCPGGSPACPSDAKSTAECRAVAGICDVAESCNGVSNNCPADSFEPASQECRASAGVCDVAENCTGTGSACPSDAKSTAECRAPADVCDAAESCDGASNSCPADGFEPASQECRASAGVCDIAEKCTGSGVACPADAFESAGTVCRSDAGDCDVEEVCSGSGPNCPVDAFEPAGTSCDDEEVCTIDDVCEGDGSCIGDPMTCGDGVIQGACNEECDDGGTGDGDGCSGACTVEFCYACSGEPSGCDPDVGAPCDDGDLCTNADACNASAVCSGEERPRPGCRKPTEAGKAILLIKDRDNDKGDQVLFKWIRGVQTSKADFGRPTSSDYYAFCLYDESGDTPSQIFKVEAPARSLCKNSKVCWRENKQGFNYSDGDRSRNGLQKLQLKEGGPGKAKVQVKAKGENLTLPALPLAQDSTVTAQIVGSNGLCFDSTFSGPAKNNRLDLFKDKGD